MCGIAGYFGSGDETVLKNMTNQISYRGPDDVGTYVHEKIGLGHRRLSIMDISSAGHQPMTNEDGSVVVVFNGEIYNFKELRSKLVGRHTFVSDSDTEVIVHLYEEVGEKVFAKLDGMFAIAIYDRKKDILLLARDRFGKKPLYWGMFEHTLLFGSEIKSLARHPLFKKELDTSSLQKYLLFDYVPTPYSMFKNVCKLEPATYLRYDGSSISKEKFWSIDGVNDHQNRSLEENIQTLDGKLDSAVKKRLMSDVPLGIFLSGGVDSSTIAWYAQKNMDAQVKTFSISFNDPSFDESSYARSVAGHLGTDHYEETMTSKDCVDIIPKLGSLLDEPMADASLIPTFLLSQITKKKVTVALGGDGADELFLGYPTFLADDFLKIYTRLPKVIRKYCFEGIAKSLPVSFDNISLDYKIKTFLRGLPGEHKYLHMRWLGSFLHSQQQELLMPGAKEGSEQELFESVENIWKEIGGKNYHVGLSYLYLRSYLMDDILCKVDRASMYNSLEVRSPFLDTELVEFAIQLQKKQKMFRGKSKYILKELMKDRLPKEILHRKKKGFGVPMAKWIGGDLKPLVTDLLCSEAVKKQGLFNERYIKDLLDDHFSKKVDNRKLIWNLLVFQMWWKHWYKTL